VTGGIQMPFVTLVWEAGSMIHFVSQTQARLRLDTRWSWAIIESYWSTTLCYSDASAPWARTRG